MNISVVIPAYDEEFYISNCLESLMHQIEKPFEIIVVNNNSRDKTVEIARKFAVKIIDEKKQGMIPARNAGFNAAKGDVIARTDADTIVPVDWTKRIREAFEKDEALLGFSGSAHFYDFPKFLQIKNWPVIASSKFVKIFLKHDGMFGFNMALSKKAWNLVRKDVCLDDRKVHEDTDIAFHISRYGKVVFDKTLVVHTAPRQIKNLKKGFEYIHRGIKMINHHKGKNSN